MANEQVRFYSHGVALAGTLTLPDDASAEAPVPAIVQGHLLDFFPVFPGLIGLTFSFGDGRSVSSFSHLAS